MLTQIHEIIGGIEDRRGEIHVDCPFCGKPYSRGQTHFSYSPRGYCCMVCGERGGLKKLHKHIGGIGEWKPSPVPIKQPKKRFNHSWRHKPLEWYQKWYMPQNRYEAWKRYKPIDTKLIDMYHLGFGRFPQTRIGGKAFPSSKCTHNRLILPIFNSRGQLVCLRGRAIDCDCGKWLVASGWSMDDLPLFNSWEVNQGDVVIIGENPVDAIMGTNNEKMIELVIDQLTIGGIIALGERGKKLVVTATLSVSYWLDAWCDSIKKASQIIVMYDNDWPGNGLGERQPEGKKANGAKLANAIGGTLFQWGSRPIKYDIGDYLAEVN